VSAFAVDRPTLCELLILWLVVELVLCFFRILGRFGPTVVDPVMLVLGVTQDRPHSR
jgi:hypothetical protein